MKRMRGIFLLALALFSTPSQAAFDLSILDPSTLNGVLPDDVAKEAVKTFGIYFAHRPYTGATSMYGKNALDLKFEVTLMKIGSGLNDALTANGLSSNSSSNTSALPTLKVHLRKPLNKTADMGVSGIYYMGQYAIGTDLKFELNHPEEGICTAFRFNYSYATAQVLYLKSVHVISPEFVMSRPFSFAEPYFGFGGRVIFGTVSVPFDLPPATVTSVEKTGTGYTAYAFTGVSFDILGERGFRFGMEGHYDLSGFSSLGTMFGIAF